MQYITILILYGMVLRKNLSNQLREEEDFKFIYFLPVFS